MRAVGVGAALCACALVAGACATAPQPAPQVAAADASEAINATVEATSLLGKPLETAEPTGEFRQRQEALLAEARERLDAAPDNVDAWIWVGRRLGYLGRFRDAIAHYSEAIERFPDAAELYRHRGHRYLSVRELDNARADLERAVTLMASRPDAVEQDGLPNERNQPTGTLRSNVWYHLALARHLLGDEQGAIAAWEEARDAVDNPDNLVAASYWLYLECAAAGDAAGAKAALAPIKPDLDVIENDDYHRLLLVFRGDADAQELLAEAEKAGGVQLATVGYGLAAWHLQRGERTEAARLLRHVVDHTPWPAFGHLAAEALLARDAELRRLAGL